MSDTACGDTLNLNVNSVSAAAEMQNLRYARKYLCVTVTVFACDINLFKIVHLKLQLFLDHLTIAHNFKIFYVNILQKTQNGTVGL